MTKEYLRMADVFRGGERQSGVDGVGGVIDAGGELVLRAIESKYCSGMMPGVSNEYRDAVAKYAAHAITSHDELVAEVERLRGELSAASNVLDEVDRVISERIKNGAYDLDDIADEVSRAIERINRDVD